MITIEIVCPICKNKGRIELSKNSLKDFSRGILAIDIKENSICKDSFIAYIDKDLKVRDYFIVDFQVELPEIILDKDK
ncbi:MAG: hypothetical protein ACFFAO_21780, partial [Candidatus Hermodarchaeota archaeon]